MSHFSCLVITEEKPTEESIAAIMQPFHEFECTGIDDEYVVDVDETEEFLASYNSKTRPMMRMSDGEIVYRYDDSFYREPTTEESALIGPFPGTGGGNGISWASKDWGDGKGYRAKVHFVPAGCTEEDAPVSSVMTMREFAEYRGEHTVDSPNEIDVKGKHKYGHALFDGNALVRSIRRTNPQKKWDWYQIGGRWSGLLLPKNGTESECETGCPGTMGAMCDEAGVDVAMKANVDWGAMSKRETDRKIAAIHATLERLNGSTGMGIDELLSLHRRASVEWSRLGVEAALQELPGDNPISKAKKIGLWHRLDALVSPFGAHVPENEPDPFEWAKKTKPFSCFAMLIGGKWLERGDMGFWACVSNENENHAAEFAAALESVPDSHWLTVVDCHI